jgi:DNA-binding NarL/FixJ family response regulator
MKILIVEDDVITRSLLAELLQPFDPDKPTVVDRLSHMWAKLEESDWDVLLLDVFLPDCNDRIILPVCEQLRSLYPDLAIIITSGFTDEKFAEDVLDYGADRFLPKKGEVIHLYEVLLAAVERHSKNSGDFYLEVLRNYVSAKKEGKLP